MILWSALPFSIVAIAARGRTQFCGAEWLLVIPIGAFLLGVWLVYTATRTTDAVFEKQIDGLDGGGQWFGLVLALAVLIVAIPIYEIYRLIRTEYES